MENEIKVGEYIRTKDGRIGTFEEIDEHCRHYGERLEDKIYIVNTEKNEYLRLTENEIVKHSPNLIDLIQCGDYVNGHLVIDIPGDESGVVYLEQITKGALIPTLKEDIQTIVTKEMMESISYKV